MYGARYISDRFLPDKAIGEWAQMPWASLTIQYVTDLVDEAASALRLAQESKPDELEALDRDMITLQVCSLQLCEIHHTNDFPHRLNWKVSRMSPM